MSKATPMTWAVSKTTTTIKSRNGGRFHVRKKQIREDRNHMKNSGMTKQKKSVHIQATRSSSLICEFVVTPDSVLMKLI